jgi:hypothetical protein
MKGAVFFVSSVKAISAWLTNLMVGLSMFRSSKTLRPIEVLSAMFVACLATAARVALRSGVESIRSADGG